MKIEDYLRALEELPDSDLDEHILQRSETEIRFERVRAPSGNWSHAQGAIINAPGRTNQNDSSDGAYKAEMIEFDRQMMSSRNFLPGFITDLRAAFGGNITITSITANKLDGNKPITARAVKSVIEHAKTLRTKQDSLPIEARMEAEALTRSTNARVISSYINNSIWIGVLFDGERDPNDDRLPLAGEIGRLGKHSAQFVKTMVTEMCKQHPKYSQDCFELPDFIACANIILQKYHNILHCPGMTPKLLEATFAKATEIMALQGAKIALAKLPVLAATTCLMFNLNPEEPGSLISAAIARACQRSPGSTIPEITLTRIRRDFPARFKDAQTKHKIPQTATPVEAYVSTVNLGTQILDEMLSNFRQLALTIETSSEFSARQKTTLSLWHGEGILNADMFSDAERISNRTKQVLAIMLDAAQDKDFPASLIFEALEAFANMLIELANVHIRHLRNENPKTTTDTQLIDDVLKTYCQSFIRAGVFGFHQKDVRRLLGLLNGEIGEALDQLLQQGPSLPAAIHAELIDACQHRAEEIDDDWHTTLETKLNDALKAELSAEEDNDMSTVTLSDGNIIGNKFLSVALYSSVTLRWQGRRSILDSSDWKSLPNSSKEEKLQAIYAEIIDSVFDGDENRATLFTQQVMAQIPATYALWDNDPARTPLRLPDGTPFKQWEQCTETLDITLIDIKRGQLAYATRQQIISPRAVIDREGGIHWLDQKKSGFDYCCGYIMTRAGDLIVSEPVRVLSMNVTPNGWPKQDYPEPIPEDLSEPGYDAHDDLVAYVRSTGNRRHINAVMALDAVHAFEENPSHEQALLIHEQFIASGALNWLADPIAVAYPGLLEITRYFDAQPVINALRPIALMLESAQDDWHYGNAEPSMVAFKHQIEDFIAEPTMEKLEAIDNDLDSETSKYPKLQGLIPDDLVAGVANSMNAMRTPIDATAFEPLEFEIINFIAREILPGFIESVRAETAPETTAHT